MRRRALRAAASAPNCFSIACFSSVDDQRAIVDVVRYWIDDPGARQAAGAAARRLVEENAGATTQSVALIEALLDKRQAAR